VNRGDVGSFGVSFHFGGSGSVGSRLSLLASSGKTANARVVISAVVGRENVKGLTLRSFLLPFVERLPVDLKIPEVVRHLPSLRLLQH
jgi:hypothetical protein